MKSIEEMSNPELINMTIRTLNCGEYPALEVAKRCRKEAKRRGDKELINILEYLWDVS